MSWLVEGSSDGVNWRLYASANNVSDAKKVAAKCILHTNHTHIRYIPFSQRNSGLNSSLLKATSKIEDSENNE